MREKEYERLTRARQRSGFAVVSAIRSSLWLAKDHLLCIDTTGYTESYKRFYFRDIQAIIVRQTDRHKYWSLAWVVIGGLFALFAFLSEQVYGRYILGALALLFGLLLVLNLVAGPASVCHLRTAVQMEELPSLNRLRRARRVLARIRPLITAVQGEAMPEAIISPAHEPGAAPPQASANPQADAGSADDPNVPPRILS